MLEFLRALRRAHRAVEARILADLHAAGFSELRSTHLMVLRHLDPEGRRTTDLACAAEVTRQAVSQVVAELEALGIVAQGADPEDGRARLVRYTARGLEGVAAANRSFETMRTELCQELSLDSVEQLMTDLEMVRAIAARDRTALARGAVGRG